MEFEKTVDFSFDAAESLHPFLALQRKKKTLLNAVSQSFMGVSAILNHARSMITLDDGEHEIIESIDDGTCHYQIDGNELTFDSWSRYCGSDNSVASCKNKRQFRSKVKLTPNILTFSSPPDLTSNSLNENNSAKTSETKKRKREHSLEEGEIASWSSDDDNDIETIPKKSKRAERRKQERQNVQNNHNAIKQQMDKIYNNRMVIVSNLNAPQSVQMVQSLRMVYDGQSDEVMKKYELTAKFLSNNP